MAEYMSSGERPEILRAFQLKRFLEGRYSGETASIMKYGHWD